MSNPITPVIIPEKSPDEGFCLAELLIEEGQRVRSGQRVAKLEGKAVWVELYASTSGYIIGLHAIAGQKVFTNQILCGIGEQPSVAAGETIPTLIPALSAIDPTALLLFGGGGHGKALIDLIRASGTYRMVGIIDDYLPIGSDVLGVPVIGGADQLRQWRAKGIGLAANAVGGIGNFSVRVKVFDLLAQSGFTCPALIHPSAVIERSAQLAGGIHVLPQAYVGSAAQIGFGSVLNAGVIVSHDCSLGKVVNLSPGATLAGNVHIEDYAQVGMGATVNLGLTIGARARLGNSCTVKADVPADGRVWAGTIWPLRPAPPSGAAHVS